MKSTLFSLVLVSGILSGFASAAQKEAAAPDPTAADRATAEARLAANGVNPYSTDPKDKKKVDAQKKADLADYKAIVKENKDNIKAMFDKAEALWKAQSYKEAATWYQSVAQATVTGSEDMVETANTRLNYDMENLAKDHVRNATDAGLRKDYPKEVEELSIVTKEFGITKTAVDARKVLVSLKAKPEVAGYIEYTQAEQMLADNKLTEGIAALNAIINNSRYDNSLPSLRAHRKLDELNRNEDTRARIKTEFAAKAEKEAPQMIMAAKNYAANHMTKAAIEKLELVVDKFPGTTYEEEAKKKLAELK